MDQPVINHTDLHSMVFALCQFVRRANCRDMPGIAIDFKSSDDRARFVVEFESTIKPIQFEEGRRFGATEGVFLTPMGVSVRLTVNGR